MAMLTMPLLLCAAFVLSGATALPVESAEVLQQQDPPLEMGEEGNLTLLKREEVEVQEEMVAESSAWWYNCPAGWAGYGRRCYRFIGAAFTWINAELFCVQLGGNLASVHSAAQYRFLQEVVRRSTGGYPPAWIGGTDISRDRTWLWSDGSKFDYRQWARGEPNNHFQREPCMSMNHRGGAGWNDATCNSRFSFVCSRRR